MQNKLKLIFKYKNRTSILLTALYCLIVMPIMESIAFSPPENKNLFVYSIFLKVLFTIFFYVGTRLTLYAASKLYIKDPFFIQWSRYALIYGSIIFIVFLLLYPGHWVWDEFNILNAVKHYQPDSWQNIFTNIYYTFCLYLIPTGVSIVFFQLVVAATTVGYVLAVLSQYVTNKKLVYLILAFFLLPPILINNLYPLRLTIYSYLELLFLVKFIQLYLSKKQPNPYHTLLGMSFLITALSFWRSEGIYYLLLVPIVIYKLNIFTKKASPLKRSLFYTGLSLMVIICGYGINKTFSSDRYSLTAIINPISVMIQQSLKDDNSNSDLAKIDKVINLKLLHQYPSYTEIPGYWAGAVREDYSEHLTEFYKAYVHLIINNPVAFIDARIKTFLATNALDKTTPTPLGMLAFKKQFTPESDKVVNRFFSTNYAAQPLNYDIKYQLTRSLLMLNEKDQVSILGKFIWSIIPIIAILLAIFAWLLHKRLWVLALIIGLIFTRVMIIFLTAPAHYFMYYLPVYISGGTIIIMFGILQYEYKIKHAMNIKKYAHSVQSILKKN